MTMIENFYPPGWQQVLADAPQEVEVPSGSEWMPEVTPEEDEAFERLLQLAGISE